MMLQVAVNGDRSKADHPAVPVTAEELARDARECLAAGAQEFHVHVRDGDGHPTLAPGCVDAAVSAMHSAGAHVVGVTTIADIEPDLQRRLDLVSRWTRPAYSSVNLSEEGAVEVMRALLAAGAGIEAGVWSPDDARALVACGLADRVTRILVEPGEAQGAPPTRPPWPAGAPTAAARQETLPWSGRRATSGPASRISRQAEGPR